MHFNCLVYLNTSVSTNEYCATDCHGPIVSVLDCDLGHELTFKIKYLNNNERMLDSDLDRASFSNATIHVAVLVSHK